jgi:hypothetical protein
MKLVGLLFLVVACSGPKAKPESPLVKEGSAVPETCCCKSTPPTSEDAKPVFEQSNRMDCSSKQGDCVDDVQCNKGDAPPATM